MALDSAFLKKLSAICLSLPEVTETRSWGHPTFKAGKKVFAVYEEYRGDPSLAVMVGTDAQQALTLDPRFYITPYIGHRGWVSLKTRDQVRWDEIRALVEASYRLLASKRLLRVLDGRRGLKASRGNRSSSSR